MPYRIRSLAAAAAVASLSVVAVATPAHAADPIKSCGPAPTDHDGTAWPYFTRNNEILYRSANTGSTHCALGQRSHKADYHCYVVGSDGNTWTYVRDATTTYAGWVRDSYLANYGSSEPCP